MSAALRSTRALVTGGSRGIGAAIVVAGASLTIDGGFTAQPAGGRR